MSPKSSSHSRKIQIKLRTLRKILLASFLSCFFVFSFISLRSKRLFEVITTNPVGVHFGDQETVPTTLEKNRPKNLIYLTFDDGPSEYTAGLLDVLKRYNVKATFFITGSGDDEIIRRAYDEGHTIAIHTNSHNYSYIYSNVDNYFADLFEIQNRIKNLTGESTNLLRFPGGSSNTVSARYKRKIMTELSAKVEDQGFVYFDWNIDSDDAGRARSSSEVSENVISKLSHDGPYVVLQHDTKSYSVDAVAQIIEYGQQNNYIFAPLQADSYSAHHSINN